MRFGVVLPNCGVGDDPRAVIDLVIEAEAAGWDGAFIWDVPLGYPGFGAETQKMHEAWALFGAMAVRTDHIMLGTMITPLAWRSPVFVAKQASTLQALSNGRFVLSVGLGAGPDGGTYLYEEEDRRKRARMVDEGLGLLQQLWSGEPIHFDGTYYRVRNEPVMLPVVSPRPTVWMVGAWNHDPDAWPKKKSFRRALSWDGLLPHFFRGSNMVGGEFDPDSVRALAEDIRRERSEPFDLILEGSGENGENTPVEKVRALADAGATWFNEGIWESMYRTPGDATEMRERIRRGPPKI